MLIATILAAATASTDAAAVTIVSQTWQSIVLTGVGLVLTYYLVPLLQRKAQESAAAAAQANVTRGAAVADRVKSFLFGTAAAVAEKRFPILAQKVVTGQLRTSDQVKTEMRSWGVQLKSDAIRYFQGQNLDIVTELGDDFVNKLIERAANQVSPFPGMETSKVLLQKDVADMLIKKGVDYMKDKAGEFECKACIPVCEGCKT